MARLIFATLGSSGDVRPILAIAMAVRARGHDVAVATTPAYRSLIEGRSVQYLEFGNDEYFDDPSIRAAMLERTSGFSFWMAVSNLPHLEEMCKTLLVYCQDADAIVSTPFVMTAHLAAEYFKIPLVNCCLSPASYLPDKGISRGSDANAINWIRRLNAIRADLRLPRVAFPQMGRFNAAVALGLYPECLRDCEQLTIRNIIPVGYPLLRGDSYSNNYNLEKWISKGNFCLFTFGSYVDKDRDVLFKAAVSACKKLRMRCLYVSPFGSHKLDSSDEDVRVENYVGHNLIMPAASVIIHHGGTGTLSEALICRKPVVVIPFGLDQYYNAGRLNKSDLAEILPADEVDEESLTRAIVRALTEGGRRAETLASKDLGAGADLADIACDRICEQIQMSADTR